jgi:iron complex outermembrane receptor protein
MRSVIQKAATAIAVPALFAGTVAAHEQGRHSGRDAAAELDGVIVTASPLRQSPDEVGRPVEVLGGTGLDDARAATLGETVAGLPGVHATAHGPAVGRPVIRGLDGPRVRLLGEGLGTMDVSTVSVDHAVAIDPFLADQIEVFKGPATLLFGSGAVGGAVNVVDGRIHEQPLDGLSGRAEVRGSNVADERAGAFRIDGGAGSVVLHADAFYRTADDYRIPGNAAVRDDDLGGHDELGHAGPVTDHDHESGEHDHDHGDHDHDDADRAVRGRLAGTAYRTRGGGAGFSHVGERGFAGVSVSRYESIYGVPGHVHHDDHGHHDMLLVPGLHARRGPASHAMALAPAVAVDRRYARSGAGDHDHEDAHDHAHEVSIDLAQTRVDAKAGITAPLAGHETMRVRIGHSDYGHVELEDGVAMTTFGNQGVEGRIELLHAPVAGWRGAYGIQAGRRRFSATGAEAFVPSNRSREAGVFVVEGREWERLRIDVGGRYDRVSVDPGNAAPRRRFDAFSASASGQWQFTPQLHLRVGLDRAQRAPTAEELYSDGLHVATGGYETGDPHLQRETANQVELGLHWHGDVVEARAAVYRNDFDDFLYLQETGEGADDLPLRAWRQDDARFRGAEADVRVRVHDGAAGRVILRAMADTVRAERRDGTPLPRIAPGRFGGALEWSRDGWRASASVLRYRAQRNVAEHETPTDGYTTIDADLAHSIDIGDREVELFLQGRNLGNAEIRLHTSFLKDVAPQPGRSIGLGLRAFF